MAWTSGNPVSIGDPTKKSHFDNVFDNSQFERNTTTGAILATLLATFNTGVAITGNLDVVSGISTFSRADATPSGTASTVYDDGVFGSTDTVNTGITILGSGQTGIAFGDAGSASIGQIRYQHGANRMEFVTSANEGLAISSTQQLSSGAETAPDVDGGGLCLQQGAGDGNILTLKSTDVSNPFTTIVDDDTYTEFQKYNIGTGGVKINGYEDDGTTVGVAIQGHLGSTTTTGIAVVIEGYKLSGTTRTRIITATEKVCVINGQRQWTWWGDGGVTSSNSPTGGNKGNGTLNAKAVYDDNVLLTGYVLDAAVDGKIDYEFWNKKSPSLHQRALGFDLDRLDVDKFSEFWRANKYLPSMFNDRAMNHNDLSTGQIINGLWETVEVQAIHIDNLNVRLKKLEKHIFN